MKEELIKNEILEILESKHEISDKKLQEVINEYLLNSFHCRSLTFRERADIAKNIFDSIRKLDILQMLLEDDEITEIMVNGTERIFIEKNGTLIQTEKRFKTKEDLQHVINQIVSQCNRVVNEATPIVDARLEDGSRVNVVLNPIALNGPILTIRKFYKDPMTFEKLIEYESLTMECAKFLKMLVQGKYNIIVSGGTGSGKTTFLNALSTYILDEERIITIEDSAELQISHIPNLVRLETRNATIESCKAITIRELIKSSLRMRPTRIIVGEVRGAEAMDMIGSAMNCGHDGSMSTAHANSAKDALLRLESMILMAVDLPIKAIRRQIASGVDIIIQLGRV
ncbi:MAG: CpaF family protein, partial [Lachnospiraceae bacterium]